jgi:phosphatidate cytidylyltransferase
MGLIGTNYGRNYLPASYHYYLAAAIAAIFGTMGDLIESKIKRLANVKDSGNIIARSWRLFGSI